MCGYLEILLNQHNKIMLYFFIFLIILPPHYPIIDIEKPNLDEKSSAAPSNSVEFL